MSSSETRKVIRVGSRKSELALIQTRHVIAELTKLHPQNEFEIVTMNTLGDKVLDIPLPKIGEKSLFTKELETALANGSVDFVVHSLKDLPTTLPAGMAIGAVLKREDPRDALVLQRDLNTTLTLATLPKDAVIGTSSLRRTAQLGRKYPHLKVEDIRGNLNTRLRKLDEMGKYTAIILAAAGLERIGWTSRISRVLDCDEFLYAVGQGALAVECRRNDDFIVDLLSPMYDYETGLRVIAERTFLRTLGGGCSAPVAITSNVSHVAGSAHRMRMTGAVWSLDGREEVRQSAELMIDLSRHAAIKECPYKDKCNNVCVLRENEKNQTSVATGGDEPTVKKQKTSNEMTVEPVRNSEESEDIPLALLRTDPHEHCPVAMPVGADFMGKCPYLELAKTKPHVAVNVNEVNGNFTADIAKCPYMMKQLASEVGGGSGSGASQSADDANAEGITFCGLVPHKQLHDDVLEKVEAFGKQLADDLIQQGALTIMAKAQAHIRSNVAAH